MSSRKHIHIVSAKIWGGGETYVYNLAKIYGQNNNGVVIFCESQNKYILNRLAEVAEVIPINLSNVRLLSNSIIIARYIKKNKPSTLNYHSGRDSKLCYLIKKLTNIPTFFFKHNITVGKNDFYHNTIYRNLNRIICVSRRVSSTFSEHLSIDIKKKITMVHSGIFIPETEKIIKKQNKNQLIIGYAGRITQNKGIEKILAATSLIKKVNFSLKIAGSGEKKYLEYLNNHYPQSEKISFLGQLSELDNFYRSIDIFIAPSIVPEAFGLAICEAMSYGCIVISSNSGAQSEIINDHQDGYLLDPFTPQSLANLLQEIQINNNFHITSYYARRKIESKFKIDFLFENLEEIYDREIKE